MHISFIFYAQLLAIPLISNLVVDLIEPEREPLKLVDFAFSSENPVVLPIEVEVATAHVQCLVSEETGRGWDVVHVVVEGRNHVVG